MLEWAVNLASVSVRYMFLFRICIHEFVSGFSAVEKKVSRCHVSMATARLHGVRAVREMFKYLLLFLMMCTHPSGEAPVTS